MNTTNRIIFHLPDYIDIKYPAGSQIRPLKMLNAFLNLGYEVDIVSGYAQERKKSIQNIKNKILTGIKYKFAYSESSTMPTLLTEKHRLPIYPFLDFGFFQFLKKNQINIGLFYRDVFWAFERNTNHFSSYKRHLGVPFYKYDIWQYNRLLHTIFLPSIMMRDHIPGLQIQNKVYPLPPACTLKSMTDLAKENRCSNTLNLLYVGGVLPPYYDLSPLIQSIKNTNAASLALVCRQHEWEEIKDFYQITDCNNLSVAHVSGQELDSFYSAADLFAIFRQPNFYYEFAMPVKLFEALGYGLPIITNAGTAVARFVEENNVGWVISTPDEFNQLISYLNQNCEQLIEMKKRVEEIRHQHTWSTRTETVAKVLSVSRE